ncbi:SIR2 family protein [Serratia nevei]|uniref:P-loop NTPase n=2 Tax=Serratia TaxID=613 RepID=UPI0019192021|nr:MULTISPECIES: SIR2 family protein [Serratia]MDK5108004.1 SIR2 family protein [Serratia nevei]MDK5703894.1 SIR2 family protein [Serratia nevei]MDK5835385.1 SIR2 family protein [Serratia nevei]MDK6013923.1 SIR2 family protein [Serratia nevei]MEC5576103.1 SIR2 family protein [Serratia nevei]
MDIPHILSQNINSGRVVLFLGSGATIGAKTQSGKEAPKGNDLANILSKEYFGEEKTTKTLSSIAELAISETDIHTVQQFVKDYFDEFEPAEFHLKIPTFRWVGIYTTNYDLVIERAYQKQLDKTQNIKCIYKNSDRVDEVLRTTDSICYVKLHGCITKTDDLTIPLILTPDQYVTHKRNRDRLFNRLDEHGHQYTIVFIGYSLDDSDLRQALLSLSETIEERPRFYTVTPSLSDAEVRMWEKKKITPLKGTFEDFINSLDQTAPVALRNVSRVKKQHEIERVLNNNDLELSSKTLELLSSELVFIRSDMPTNKLSPSEFYKGSSYGWESIKESYDCRRSLTDTIISEVILLEEIERSTTVDFFLVKGHAGAGKTITLKRIAWDSAIEYNRIVLYWESSNKIELNSIFEICERANDRVFLFVDKVSFHISEVISLIKRGTSSNLKLTIISSERGNEWNMECEPLHSYVSREYKLPYLKEKEIKDLLDKLERFQCLGLIKDLAREKQEEAFRSKAGRQILVALYEVTMGKSFEDIVFDEYNNIEPEQARLIYRTICALNRLGVSVRTGIIHRIFGVPFEIFKQKFFSPLENIVQVINPSNNDDYAYQARHPLIAEFVFARTMLTEEDREDLYFDLIDSLDIGYSSDKKAYREIIKAKNLMSLFNDPLVVRRIYDSAKQIGEFDDYYHQQIAIFEMKRKNPNFRLAEQHLDIAAEIAPYNPTINHTRSELELQKARGGNDLERERFLSRAREYALNNIRSGYDNNNSHSYHTLCKVHLEKISTILNAQTIDEKTLKELIKEFVTTLHSGLQKYPNSEFLLEAESKLSSLLNDNKGAIASLEKAFNKNSASTFISIALSKAYIKNDDVPKARGIMEKVLEYYPADKVCNGRLAKIITDFYPQDNDLAEYYWRRSFTEGDSNVENQFWYARQLYINKKYEDSKHYFAITRRKNISPEVKSKIRGPIFGKDGVLLQLGGAIVRKDDSYCFVRDFASGEGAFLHKKNITDPLLWDQLRIDTALLNKSDFG